MPHQHAVHALACTVEHVVCKHTQAAGHMGLPRHRIANGTGLQQTKLADTGSSVPSSSINSRSATKNLAAASAASCDSFTGTP